MAEELSAPLLQPLRQHERPGYVRKHTTANADQQYVGLAGGISNLTKCVLGAGLLSMPQAFSLLGAGLGTLALMAVALLTMFTIQYGVVVPSVTYDSQGSLRFGTYSSAVQHWVGKAGERTLIFMLIVGLLGFEASYNDIIADVLLGNGPDRPGLLPLTPTPGEPWIMPWLRDRRFLLALVVAVVILPLSMRRHMGSLNAVNAVGLVSLLAFMVSLVWLAMAAASQGKMHALPLLPDYDQLGLGFWRQSMTAFGTLSVLLTANACHANMHPLMSIVRPFTRHTITQITVITITFTSVYYYVVMACAYLVFGQSIQDDILTNLSVPAMEPLVGAYVAQAMSVVLRVGYMVSVMGSAVLTMFPLRQAVADFLVGPPPQPPQWLSTPPGSRQSASHHHSRKPSATIAAHASTLTVHANGTSTATCLPTGVKAAQHAQHTGAPHTARTAQDNDLERCSDVPVLAAMQLHAAKRASYHVPVTLVLLAAAYLLAVSVPSIWVVISVVGSTMGACCSFIIPSIMGLACLADKRQQGLSAPLWIKTLLYAALGLGLSMLLNAFALLFI